MHGHADQFVNASLASDLGLGFSVTEQDVLDRLLEMYRQDTWIGRKPMPPAFEINGDVETAGAILAYAHASNFPHPQLDLFPSNGRLSDWVLNYAAYSKHRHHRAR